MLNEVVHVFIPKCYIPIDESRGILHKFPLDQAIKTCFKFMISLDRLFSSIINESFGFRNQKFMKLRCLPFLFIKTYRKSLFSLKLVKNLIVISSLGSTKLNDHSPELQNNF